MIDWTHLAPLFPGRGVPVPGAKRPSAKKAWTDTRKALEKALEKHLPERDPYNWPPPAATDDEGEHALTQLRAMAASTAAPDTFEPAVQAVAMEVLTNIASRETGKAGAALASWWTHVASPAQVVEALADLWHWSVSEREVERRSHPYRHPVGPETRIGPAVAVLRAWLGSVDDEAYGAGARAATRLPPGPPDQRALWAFLFPSEPALVTSAFESLDPQRHIDLLPWLACVSPTLETAHEAVVRAGSAYGRAVSPVPTALLHVAPVDAAIPWMLEHWRWYGAVLEHVGDLRVLEALVERHGARGAHVASYLARFPELAASAGLGPAPAPEAPAPEGPTLPPWLVAPPKPLSASTYFRWVDDEGLTVDGTPLTAQQHRHLGIALYRSKGRPTKALRELRPMLDAASRVAFGERLFARLLDTYPEAWWMRAMWFFVDDGDRFIDDVAKHLPSMEWSVGAGALETALRAGGDRGLQLVAHHAEKAKGKGVRNKAAKLLAEEAKRRGLDPDALDDRIVPDLGLRRGTPEVLDLGPVQVTVGLDGSVVPFVRLPDGTVRTKLPTSKTHDPAKVAVAKARWSQLRKDLRRVASTQRARLERAMVQGRTWTVEDFEQYLVDHPVQGAMVRGLVWRSASGSFRIDEAGAWADVHDEAVAKGGPVALVHPAELSGPERSAWQRLLVDYEIVQPFPQLTRPVHRRDDPATAKLLERVDGARVPSRALMDLLGRGWRAGETLSRGRYEELELERGGVQAMLRVAHGLYVQGFVEVETQTVRLDRAPTGGSAAAYSEAVQDLAGLLDR